QAPRGRVTSSFPHRYKPVALNHRAVVIRRRILIDCNDNKSAKHLLDLRAGVAVERESGRSGNTKIVRCGEHEYPVAATPQYPSDFMHRLARSLRTRTFEDTDADHEVERAIRMPDTLD